MLTPHEANIDTTRHRQSRKWRVMINVGMATDGTAGLTQYGVHLYSSSDNFEAVLSKIQASALQTVDPIQSF